VSGKVGEIGSGIDKAVRFVLEAANRDTCHDNAEEVESDELYAIRGRCLPLSNAIGLPLVVSPSCESSTFRRSMRDSKIFIAVGLSNLSAALLCFEAALIPDWPKQPGRQAFNARGEWEFHKSMRHGHTVYLNGRVFDRWTKRGKEYFTIDMLAVMGKMKALVVGLAARQRGD
jgi:hypothetical protein